MSFTPDEASLLILRLSLTAVVIICAEILFARADYTGSGVLNWEVVRTLYGWDLDGAPARALDAILRYPRFMWLVGALLCIAVALMLNVVVSARLYLLTVAVIIWLLVQARLRFGLDGADQMVSIVLIAMWFYYLTDDARVRAAALAFVALQLILSYITSGIAKLLSSEWRDGSAIAGVLRTRSYGSPRLATVLYGQPVVARAVCYAVIGFECLGWVSLFGGPQWRLGFIVGGFAFHLGVAFTMGLNSFLWSFAAALPAVYLLPQNLQRCLEFVRAAS